MAKSKKQTKEKSKEVSKDDPMAKLPKEQQQKLKQIKSKIDKFTKKATEKFEKYIMGIALLPPPKPEEGKKVDKDLINVLVLVDDSEPTKMSKGELGEKLGSIIEGMGKEIDENIKTETILLSEVWQNWLLKNQKMMRIIN